jgi:hypothetical protein
VTARYYFVTYIRADEGQPGFETQRSRILHPPHEMAKNAVVTFLADSNGRAQSAYQIALRTGLDPRVVPAVVKKLVKKGIVVECRMGKNRMYRITCVANLKAA